jgi:hypothetical protein
MGFNAHPRNTAYLDTAVDVRRMCFAENGFLQKESRSVQSRRDGRK